VPSDSTKLPFHEFLGIRNCSFIAFWQHETAVSLFFGSTKLQFHCFRAARNCSFIASWWHETAVSLILITRSCNFMDRAFWQHETAVSLLSSRTVLQFHCFLAARNCSFIALWEFETAVSLLPGSTKLLCHGFLLLYEAAVSWIVPSDSTKLPFS
jgi:hypothetical protein